jgi:hypothetical protein
MARLFRLVATLLALGCADAARAETILFVGNSFTFGHLSPVMRYRPDTVTDLNGEGIGGVPALFAAFAREAGLDYQVSLETHPGVGLDWHWDNALAKIDRPWDHVVLQSLSVLDIQKPGDPALLVRDVGRFTQALKRRNPKVDVVLDATWSRADMTYATPSPWKGKPIFAMADDLSCAYRAAAAATPGVRAVAETGEAFNRAIRTGFAEPNPYAPTAGKADLWAVDHYHASAFGYYLEGLVIFGTVTGRDPLSLGASETAAHDLGFSPQQTLTLERIAHDQIAHHDRGRTC